MSQRCSCQQPDSALPPDNNQPFSFLFVFNSDSTYTSIDSIFFILVVISVKGQCCEILTPPISVFFHDSNPRGPIFIYMLQVFCIFAEIFANAKNSTKSKCTYNVTLKNGASAKQKYSGMPSHPACPHSWILPLHSRVPG